MISRAWSRNALAKEVGNWEWSDRPFIVDKPREEREGVQTQKKQIKITFIVNKDIFQNKWDKLKGGS